MKKCSSCKQSLSKKDKSLFEWYKEKKFHNPRRLYVIFKHIKAVNS